MQAFPSSALDEGPRIGRGLPHGRDGSISLGTRPASCSARNGRGINVIRGSSGSSRQSNNVAIHGNNRDCAPTLPAEETYRLRNTPREAAELSRIYDGAGLRSLPLMPYDEQQLFSSEHASATRRETFDTIPNQGTTRSHGFPWSETAEGDFADSDASRARSSILTDPSRSSYPVHLETTPARILAQSISPSFGLLETPYLPPQRTTFAQDCVDEQLLDSDLPLRDSLLPQTKPYEDWISVLEDQQDTPNHPDEGLDWQTGDQSWLDVGSLAEDFNGYLHDEVPTAPEQPVSLHAMEPPLAIEELPQPAVPYGLEDTDLPSRILWDNDHYMGFATRVDPPFGSYASYLGNLDLDLEQESTSGPNSDPILTPPSDDTAGTIP